MEILNFLKKIFSEKEKEKIANEEITFQEIPNWINKKIKENEEHEQKILKIIPEEILKSNQIIKEKIEILKKFDIDSKKVEERIKGIVNDSRIQYIQILNDFMYDLENISETKLGNFHKKIDKIFLNFNKNSSTSYERTTILIGKEMAEIKNSFKIFSNKLSEIFENNKKIFENNEKIEKIKEKLNSLNSIKQNLIHLEKELLSLEKKIHLNNEESKRILKKIKEIKESEKYGEKLKKKEKLDNLRIEIKSLIFNLKQSINFKSLINFFHINEKQMKIIKSYKEDFYLNFKKDEGKEFLEMLKEANLETPIILTKISSIKNKIKELKELENKIPEDNILKLENQIKKINSENEDIQIEKNKKNKKKKEIKESNRELNNSLNEDFKEINIKII